MIEGNEVIFDRLFDASKSNCTPTRISMNNSNRYVLTEEDESSSEGEDRSPPHRVLLSSANEAVDTP